MALLPRLRAARAAFAAETPFVPAQGELAVADTRRGIAFVAGQQRTYNPDDLVGKKGLKIYDEMLIDEQVKACLVPKKCAVIGPGWTVEPREKEAGQQELTDTILAQLREMDGNFSDDLWEILSALEYGFAVAEKCYAMEGGIVLRCLKTRAPHAIDFEQDPYGTVTSIVQQQLRGLQHMPPQKFVHFVHNHGFSNPYGTSDLRAAHRAWWHKRLWVQWWAIWGERYALPTAKGVHPKNAADTKVTEFLTAMKNLQTNTSMTVEEGWELEFLESVRQPREVFETAINRLDLSIAKALLLPDKVGVVGGATQEGSYALAKEQMGAFFYVLSTLARRLEDVIQEQLIDELSALIAPGIPSPKFTLLPITEENKQQIMTAFTSLVSAGVILPGLEDENHARKLLGFEEVTPEQREEREVEKQEKQEQQFERQNALTTNRNTPPGNEKPGDQKKDLSELPGRAQALKSNAVPSTFWRKLTALEERTDMAEKRDTFEALTTDVSALLAEHVQQLVSEVRADADMLDLARGVDALAIEALKVRPQRLTALALALEEALSFAYQRGITEARAELQRARSTVTFAEPVGIVGRKARSFFKQKAFFVTGVMTDEVLKRAKQVLLSAVRQDKTERQVLFELGESLAEWLPERDATGRLVNVPARLETIARTNIGEAVSEARYATFTDPALEGFVSAFRYSAILDDRVRETHRAWDGVVRPVDDGIWYTPDRRPLNGFSCRCVISPVTIADDEPMTPDDELPLDVAGPDVFPDPGFK